MNEDAIFKKQKVGDLNDAFAWKDALEQRAVFLEHIEQLIKLLELYPDDYVRLHDELRLARDKTKWSISECKKQFAFTRMRYESGNWKHDLEIEGEI